MAKNKIVKQVFIYIVMLAAVAAAGVLYKQTLLQQIRNIVMTVIGMSGIFFRIRQIDIEKQNDLLCLYIDKFYLWFICGIILSVSFPLLPANGWPYPVLAVILALFSDSLIGILSVALFTFISVTLAGADFATFYLYFASSTISVILFQKLDEEYKVYIPILVSELAIILSTTAEIILLDAGNLTIESFIIPIINVFITIIFYLIFLKYYSVSIIHKYRDKYMMITDQEYSLMVELKTKSKEAYYHAIHTAYFSNKIAMATGCNTVLAKAGAYYHRLGDFCDIKDLQIYENLLQTNEFPPDLCRLLLSYNAKNRAIVGKEMTIIYFSDAVVSSIMYLFQNNPTMEVDYGQVIDTIFDKKIASGVLNKCELSMCEMNKMKSIFKEEKLYYDFLR